MELVIGLLVTTLLLVPLSVVFWQISTGPSGMIARLTGVSQARSVTRSVGDDSVSAQVFTATEAPAYGALEGTDFTVAPPVFRSVRYRYDAAGSRLFRDYQVQGTRESDVSIGRFIPSSNDFALDIDRTVPITNGSGLPPDLLSLRMRSQVAGPLGAQARETSFLSFLRAPLPPVLPADGYALFVNHFKWSGSKSSVLGRVYSRQAIAVSGSDHNISGTMEAFAGIAISGSDNTFDFINAGAPPREMPVSYTVDQFLPCTFDFGFAFTVSLNDHPEVWQDFDARILKPGVYCALSGTIRLEPSGTRGSVTFVASSVEIPGSHKDLRAYKNGVFIFATGVSDKTVKISGSDVSWTGIIYAPAGGVDLSGSRHLMDGSIFADSLEWAGSNSSLSYIRELLTATVAGPSS